MLKHFPLLFALPLACGAQSVIVTGTFGTPILSPVSFAVPAGTYTGSQSVTITGPGGTSCFYTTDGSTPNIASAPYSGPITVSSSQTVKAVCVQVGSAYQNVQACGSGGTCKCVTVSGGTWGGTTCQSGGGVGTINPSNVAWTKATTAAMDVSTTSSTGTTQALFIWTSAAGACADCTMMAHDVVFTPDQGKTYLLNNETDANYTLPGYSGQQHSASLQCNQQSGTLQWQIDNQQGPWYNTGFTFGCSTTGMSTTAKTTARLTLHWTNGDTACGGFSCDHYDRLTVCVEGTGCQDKDLSTINYAGYGVGILPGYTEPWANIVVAQHQPDVTNTTTSGANPTTAGRTVYQDNVTVGYYSTLATGSATYTIN